MDFEIYDGNFSLKMVAIDFINNNYYYYCDKSV